MKKKITCLKERIYRFIHDEDGADLLEVCAGIVFAVMLIVVVKGIIEAAASNMSDAQGIIDNQFDMSGWLGDKP